MQPGNQLSSNVSGVVFQGFYLRFAQFFVSLPNQWFRYGDLFGKHGTQIEYLDITHQVAIRVEQLPERDFGFRLVGYQLAFIDPDFGSYSKPLFINYCCRRSGWCRPYFGDEIALSRNTICPGLPPVCHFVHEYNFRSTAWCQHAGCCVNPVPARSFG